jgi:DNA-binding NtrC family response regulator
MQGFGSGRGSDDPPRVLVVDDREAVREVLRNELADLGHRVYEARDGREALEVIERRAVDLVVSDVQMPRLDGIGLARELSGAHPPLVLFSAYGDVPTAVEAMRAGAVDFVTAPIAPEELALRIERHLRSEGDPEEVSLVGTHRTMRELRHRIARVARRDVTVMVTGESGVGKELVALEVHRRSARAAGPFVAVNCCAFPEALLESELFGHERGAFTGAGARHVGRFERSHGGTLFLDEIGDAPLVTQAKLLRVLEGREIERLGGSRTIAVDVRIIAATNRDLTDLRERREFRDDLFHRLNVFPIHVPALRERSSDIPLLVAALSRRAGLELGWTSAALDWLAARPWPGNVRELVNLLERVSILCEPHASVTVATLERALAVGGAPRTTARAAFEEEERSMLARLLAEHRFNVSAVARSLGTSRGALRHRLRKYDLG